MQELFFCLVQKLAGTVSLVQRPALAWPRDMFGEARLHLWLLLPKHNLQQWLHSEWSVPLLENVCKGCGRQGGALL